MVLYVVFTALFFGVINEMIQDRMCFCGAYENNGICICEIPLSYNPFEAILKRMAINTAVDLIIAGIYKMIKKKERNNVL